MSEQIDQFFRPDGTLISIPAKASKKIAVLELIASKLSPDTKYPEKELNAIIANFHDDTGTLVSTNEREELGIHKVEQLLWRNHVARHEMLVGVAHASDFPMNQHFVGFWCTHFNLFDIPRLIDASQYSCT
jgi:hypothetical protein